MVLLLLFLIFYLINAIKISPNEYKEADNPYEDDIYESNEAYHHIITSVSARGYIDYYKGIYYKNYLCCRWGWSSYGYYDCKDFNYETIENYTLLSNINDTNLKELLHYGCSPQGENIQQNILFDYKRFSNDSIVSLQVRMTSLESEPLNFSVQMCSTFDDSGGVSNRFCKKFTEIDKYFIPNNSFILYTLKLEEKTYWLQSDNFTIPHNKVTFNFEKPILIYFTPENEEHRLYINSYIVSVNLKRYVLSLSGHAHNYCNNHGCLDSYSCQTGTNLIYGCQIYGWSDIITECSLFGCIPGSYCNKDYQCIECDYQCRTCDQGYMNCISCYSNAIYPQWKFYRENPKKIQPCIFEFYPLNKVESHEIQVPISLLYRVTFEFWI